MRTDERCWICGSKIEIEREESTHPDGPTWIKTPMYVRVAFVSVAFQTTAVFICSDTCFALEQQSWKNAPHETV